MCWTEDLKQLCDACKAMSHNTCWRHTQWETPHHLWVCVQASCKYISGQLCCSRCDSGLWNGVCEVIFVGLGFCFVLILDLLIIIIITIIISLVCCVLYLSLCLSFAILLFKMCKTIYEISLFKRKTQHFTIKWILVWYSDSLGLTWCFWGSWVCARRFFAQASSDFSMLKF